MTAISPEQLAASDTEDGEQAALFCKAHLCRLDYPELRWLFAIPNGGDRSPSVGARLKATGVKPGVCDIMFPVAKQRYHGLFIEMKRLKYASTADGGRSKVQDEFIAFVIKQNYAAITCFGWEHAWRALTGYLSLPPFGD